MCRSRKSGFSSRESSTAGTVAERLAKHAPCCNRNQALSPTLRHMPEHHVVLADPFHFTRHAVRQFLAQHLQDFQLHDADTLLRAIHLARHHQPSTLVLEAVFTGPSTLELLVEIEDNPMIQALILTHCAIPWVAQVLLEHGAKGYLLKCDSPERCLSAIERVIEGEGGSISQRILSGLYSKYDAVGPSVDVARKALTIREWEIMIMAARGQKNARMAEEFCISVGTVKNHLYHVFDKLSMSSRLDLITWAQNRSIFRLGVKSALALHPSCECSGSTLNSRCDKQ